MSDKISASPLEAMHLGSASHDAWFHRPMLEEYRLLRLFGHGAMGCVYLAHDTLLDRSVAIKFLTLDRAHPASRERFLTEARALARLSHPNVVTIFRVGELTGHLFLVYEFIRGQSLDRLRKPVPWQRALELGLGLARGLAVAHRHSVLHRDIKPANAVLSEDGGIKLIDFGLAKLLGREREVPAKLQLESADPLLDPELQDFYATLPASWPDDGVPIAADRAKEAPPEAGVGLTQPGARLGTPLYMAPEIWRGEAALPSSDVYSLGALLYELCSGRPPHLSESGNELSRRVQEQDAPPLSDLVPGINYQLAEVIERCLRRAPKERFLDGESLCLVLERLKLPELPRTPVSGNPYRGLRPFESEHSLLFFGRESESLTVVERLRARSLLAVAGDSGVGKSSLCRAGVIPRLLAGELDHKRRWTAISLVPGRSPLRELAAALCETTNTDAADLYRELQIQPEEVLRRVERLRTARRGLVLLVDQMEELITHSDPSEAADFVAFLGELARCHTGVRVLLTMRADFLTRLIALPGLGEQIEHSLYLLPPLTKGGLRSAIVAPAETARCRFESDELISQLIEDTQRTPGGLPLLQFTLSLLWESRDQASGVVPASALRALGGFAGTLSQYADGVLADLLPDQRAEARRLMPLLVAAEGTRLRCSATDLLAVEPKAQATLESLVRARLLVARETNGESSYELAHEALLTGWELLRELLNQDHDERLVRERLTKASAEWQRLDGAKDPLWGERQLAEVTRAGVSPELLAELPRRFLHASLKRRKQQRRNRFLSAALALGLPFLAVVTLFQIRAARKARQAEAEQRQMRNSVELVEQGMRAVNLAQIPGREELAIQVALHAAGPLLHRGETPPPSVLLGMSAAVDAGRRSLIIHGHTAPLTTAFFSPDGRQIVTASADHTAKLFRAHTGELLHDLTGHSKTVRTAVFSPDGAQVLTASEDGLANLWNTATGERLKTFDGNLGPLSAAYFSPDGRLILAASFTGRIGVWELARRRLLYSGECFIGTTLTGNLLSYRAFSPDSRHLAIGRADGSVDIREAHGGTVERILPPPRRSARRQPAYAWYSLDGARLVTFVTSGDELFLWEPQTGKHIATLTGHRHPHLANFSPDYRYLVTTGDEGSIRLWNPRTGASMGAPIEAHFSLGALSFSPNSSQLLAAGSAKTAQIWSVPGGQLLRELRGHSDTIFISGYSPDGSQVVTASVDSTARVWTLGAGLNVQQVAMGKHSTLWMMLHTSDWRHVAVTEEQGTTHIVDAQTQEEVFTLPGPPGNDGGPPRFSPDGSLLAASAEHQQEWIWDWRNRRVVSKLAGHGAAFSDVAFTKDGGTLVSGGYDYTVRVWDWRRAQQLLSIGPLPSVAIGIAVAPDGHCIAASSVDGQVRVFSLSTGSPMFSLADASSGEGHASFSADGRRLLVGGLRPRVVDSWQGQVLLELSGHFDVVTQASFSSDERTILTASSDRTIRVWDARDGQLRHVLNFEDHEFSNVLFSPDDQRILLVSKSHNCVKVFPAQLQDVWRMGCALLRHQPGWGETRRDCPSDLW